ncbi:hypothetical protein DENSPDRAFT_855462 [Dentipellis sp. KUC8613]|nr:hypothetical protein DENSPDRAFT_855462 [Dentipellis sp. KUC8613]
MADVLDFLDIPANKEHVHGVLADVTLDGSPHTSLMTAGSGRPWEGQVFGWQEQSSIGCLVWVGRGRPWEGQVFGWQEHSSVCHAEQSGRAVGDRSAGEGARGRLQEDNAGTRSLVGGRGESTKMLRHNYSWV